MKRERECVCVMGIWCVWWESDGGQIALSFPIWIFLEEGGDGLMASISFPTWEESLLQYPVVDQNKWWKQTQTQETKLDALVKLIK